MNSVRIILLLEPRTIARRSFFLLYVLTRTKAGLPQRKSQATVPNPPGTQQKKAQTPS